MTTPAQTRALTRDGWLEGAASADGQVAIFKGIPFAAPPVGNLRWRVPQPVAPWQGVRPAKTFGPRSIQVERPENSIGYFGTEPQSEDCLYLNLWTRGPEDANRPVMVWIHGGAYAVGSGALPLFDGEALARSGVVLVTVNFRLGRLGFLAHPDLSRESEHGASGNYGVLDNIAALQWIQENIAAFGGDPRCVTVFGQSTGSYSVSLLMASPLARGLFHRAIGQSCARFGPPVENVLTGAGMQTLETAERCGAEFARDLGAVKMDELRARSAEEIQLWRPASKSPTAANQGTDSGYPIIDGYLMPADAYTIFAEGRQNDVPLLTGSNGNEGATMRGASSLQDYLNAAEKEFGARTAAFLKLFPALNDAQAFEASRAANAFERFTWQCWAWANLQARTGRAKVFYYRFNHIPPITSGAVFAENTAAKLGAFHGSEMPYAFQNLHVRDWPCTETDRQLSKTISAYWLNFAAKGDPNGEGLPAWPTFEKNSARAMILANEVGVKTVPDESLLQFFNEHLMR